MLSAPSPVLTLIKRELLTALRSWKSLVLLLFLLGTLYFFSFLLLSEVSQTYASSARAMRTIFDFQMGLMLFSALAFAPALSALSLSRERLDGSYDLLLTTLIPPSRVVLGKLAATLILFGLLTVALLPFTGLVYFFAGVDLFRFFQVMVAIVPTAVACAAIGLWVSTYFDNMIRALFMSFGAVFIVYFLLPGLLSWQLRSELFLLILSPFALYQGPAGLNGNWMVFALYPTCQAGIAVVATAGACIRLSRANRTPVLRSLASRVLPQQRTVGFRPITDTQNPIALRDELGTPLGRGKTRRVLFWLVALGYGATLYHFYQEFDHYVVLGTVYVERLVAFVILPPLIAVNMVRDREPITWDMIRLSLLEPSDLVVGKLRAALRLLWPLFGPVYLIDSFYLLGMTISFGSNDSYFWPHAFVAELVLLPVHLLLITTVALLAASFTRTIPAAVAAAYGSLLIGTPLFLYTQVGIVSGPSGGGPGAVTGIILFHGISCLFATFIGVAITIARIEAIWNAGIPTPVPPRASDDTPAPAP